MSYLERLRSSADRAGHVLCLGLDPDPERVARVLPGAPLRASERYLDELLDGLETAGLAPAAWKPNLAYFEQFGSAGLAWLERLLPRLGLLAPVILDAKRGDIGPSSRAYARALFETWGADAVTVNPWMGWDSVEPFLQFGGGVYLLLRTSNPGSAELQRAGLADGRELWQQLLERMIGQRFQPGLGAVVGATQPEALEQLNRLVGDCELPLLIPGVGSQGGQAREVMTRLPGDPRLHRVNVSSAILYAGEQAPELNYVEAAVAAFRAQAAQLSI